METIEKTLTDVFMPEDLCARCAEEEPVQEISLFLTPSPSSTYKPTMIFFCTEKCRDEFVRGWTAARELTELG